MKTMIVLKNNERRKCRKLLDIQRYTYQIFVRYIKKKQPCNAGAARSLIMDSYGNMAPTPPYYSAGML
jgi:hypothetical protein